MLGFMVVGSFIHIPATGCPSLPLLVFLQKFYASRNQEREKVSGKAFKEKEKSFSLA